MRILEQSIRMTLVLTVLTGILFPAFVTISAQLLFNSQANGSLFKDKDGIIRGSAIIGQQFSDDRYFHSRPSASAYDAVFSGGTNLGPISKKLIEGLPDDPSTPADESFLGINQLAAQYRQLNSVADSILIPADAITRSASGLDPHISVSNAMLQAPRVAKARGVTLDAVTALVNKATQKPFLWVFGEAHVNVFALNVALDEGKK